MFRPRKQRNNSPFLTRVARNSFVGYETLSVDVWDARKLAMAPGTREGQWPWLKGAPHSRLNREPRKFVIQHCSGWEGGTMNDLTKL